MRHDHFAEQASKTLEEIAASLEENDPLIGRGIASRRANELRVATYVVRDLSEAVNRKEKLGASVRQPLLKGPSRGACPILARCYPKDDARGAKREVKTCPS